MKRRILALMVVACAFGLPADAIGDMTLRCKNRLVSVGDLLNEVQEICGDPDQVEKREEGHNMHFSQRFNYETGRYEAPRVIEGPIRLEVWTYNFGSQRFMRYLYFENERLIRIETGDKGTD